MPQCSSIHLRYSATSLGIPLARFAWAALLLSSVVVTGCRSKSKGGASSSESRSAALVHRAARALREADPKSFRALQLREMHCRLPGLTPPDRSYCVQLARALPSHLKYIQERTPRTARAKRGYQGYFLLWPSKGGGLQSIVRRATKVLPGSMEVPQASLSIFVVQIGTHHYVADLRKLRTFGRSGLPD